MGPSIESWRTTIPDKDLSLVAETLVPADSITKPIATGGKPINTGVIVDMVTIAGVGSPPKERVIT